MRDDGDDVRLQCGPCGVAWAAAAALLLVCGVAIAMLRITFGTADAGSGAAPVETTGAAPKASLMPDRIAGAKVLEVDRTRARGALVPMRLGNDAGEDAWFWTLPEERLVVIGALIGPDGQPLTPDPGAPAGAVEAAAPEAGEGDLHVALIDTTADPDSLGSERMLVVYLDPRCPHCRDLYRAAQSVRDRLPDGVGIAWTPVGLLASEQEAAGMFAAAATSPDGLVDAPPSDDPVLIAKVRDNNRLLRNVSAGAPATPTLVWIEHGQIQMKVGNPGAEGLLEILKRIAPHEGAGQAAAAAGAGKGDAS